MYNRTVVSELGELVAWMRSVGATQARLPNGAEVTLGPAPTPEREHRTPPKPETPDEQKARRDRILLGATSMKPRTMPSRS
jgi:hypothetical protein